MPDPLFAKARRRWARTDPKLAGAAKLVSLDDRPLQPHDGFESLVSAIAHQQVSLAAGRSIWAKVESACGGKVAPESVLRLGPDGLRAAGFSRPKSAYATDLAQRVLGGSLDFDRLARSSDEDVIAALTEVKGIGVWTAKMHLLFHLRRPDVLPHEDLGLQVAVAKLYRVPREKAAAKMLKLQPAWSPYASYASLALWAWRRTPEAGLE